MLVNHTCNCINQTILPCGNTELIACSYSFETIDTLAHLTTLRSKQLVTLFIVSLFLFGWAISQIHSLSLSFIFNNLSFFAHNDVVVVIAAAVVALVITPSTKMYKTANKNDNRHSQPPSFWFYCCCFFFFFVVAVIIKRWQGGGIAVAGWFYWSVCVCMAHCCCFMDIFLSYSLLWLVFIIML